MSDLQTSLDNVNTAVANIAKQTDPAVTNALVEIASMLAEITLILTDSTAVYNK